MEVNNDLINYTKRLLLARYPSFASEIANANIEYKTNLKYHTAATDGKDIYFDPDYLKNLPDDEKIFLIAHEIMHIKFNHAKRLLDKNGNKRDKDAWNIACDAIINANLQRDGFKIKEGYVNRAEALDYNAEEFYEIVLKEKQDKKEDESSKGNSNNKDGNPNEGYVGDDHTLWEETFEKEQDSDSNESQANFDEKRAFSENRKKRREIAREMLSRMKEELVKSTQDSSKKSNTISLGNVGESKEEFDWKILLRREIEKDESIWSQRRSIAENNYAYRLEDNEYEDEAETEVMIDVSGSVDLDLVKSFLRMLKPLLRQSKLKVGCFNERFWGLVEIKSNADIDNFTIPEEARGSSAWTEDWDLAVRSFTKKKEVNKIVFTDGYPCPGNMPKEDLKNENVIWLVYGNESFKPCCGKVIQITDNQLQELQSCVVTRK